MKEVEVEEHTIEVSKFWRGMSRTSVPVTKRGDPIRERSSS